jgi:hypothetical protein
MEFDALLGIVLATAAMAFNTGIILWSRRCIRRLASVGEDESPPATKEGDDVR